MMQRVQLFATGFIQVFLVAFNTYAISRDQLLGSWVASLAISLVWTFNIKKVALGSRTDQFIYAFGASAGNVCGVIFSKYLFTIL